MSGVGDTKVILHSDVYATCLMHALCVEKEEVMGLLVGKVNKEDDVREVISCIILHRSDKTHNRVEISTEQLTNGLLSVEELKRTLLAEKKREWKKLPEKDKASIGEEFADIRIIGWYHSHPNITVWPSHVDTDTQHIYQTMDKNFIGLIFSVYSYDKRNLINKVEMTCFQSLSPTEYKEVLVEIKPTCFSAINLNVIAGLPNILNKEYETDYNKLTKEQDEFTKALNEKIRDVQSSHIVSRITWPIYYDLLVGRQQLTEYRITELTYVKRKLMEEYEQLQRTLKNKQKFCESKQD